MAGVTIDDVRHVAMLARLGVSDERARELAKELNTILEHMDALGRVDTHGVDEASATTTGMRLREDEGPAIPLAEQHAVVHLDGHLAADPQLPAPVDGGEPTRAQHAPDLVPGDVRCGDHGLPA